MLQNAASDQSTLIAIYPTILRHINMHLKDKYSKELRGIDNFKGDNSAKIILLPSEKRSILKGKSLLPL